MRSHGGVKPANFLDIGGGASAEVMANGLEIILGDPAVKSVFVNVFGGITACDAVANGIVQALELLKSKGEDVTKPLVVRLDGNNAELGRQILADANHPLVEQVDTMDGAAERAAELALRSKGAGHHTMAIFLTKESKVIVQGMTGSEGTKHTRRMLASGTNVVGGVNPRKAGTTVDFDGTEVPVFGTVAEAIEATGADVTVVFVPPKFAKDAVIEAIDAEIGARRRHHRGHPGPRHRRVLGVRGRKGNKTRIIGPNCPGLITPGQSNAGIIPADITTPGRIGLVSKSGTLTYQMMYELRDIGFSTAVGIGGDPVIGTTHIDALQAFQDDPDTDAIVMIGEIGGDAEERAAAYIEEHVTKPVVGYVAGFTAPEGKTMGHAGAIVSGSSGTAQAKKEALEEVGVRVGKTPSETARLARAILEG